MAGMPTTLNTNRYFIFRGTRNFDKMKKLEGKWGKSRPLGYNLYIRYTLHQSISIV